MAQTAQQLEGDIVGTRHEISDCAERVIQQTQCKLRALAKKFPEFLTADGELLETSTLMDTGTPWALRLEQDETGGQRYRFVRRALCCEPDIQGSVTVGPVIGSAYMPHMGYQDDITRGAVWSGLSDARSCAFYMLNWADKLQTTEKLFVEWHPRTNLIADNPALEAFLDAFDAQTAEGGSAQPTNRTTLMSAEDVVKYDQHVRPEHWEQVYEDALKARSAREEEVANASVAMDMDVSAETMTTMEGLVTFLDAADTAQIHTLTQPQAGALPLRPLPNAQNGKHATECRHHSRRCSRCRSAGGGACHLSGRRRNGSYPHLDATTYRCAARAPPPNEDDATEQGG